VTAAARERVTRSRAETEALGEHLGRAARAGDVLALWGELGAGKTTLVRGIARGLGIAAAEVTSPTFVIVHEHEGRLPLFHVDLYRLGPGDLGSTGWDEGIATGAVTAIEWPDRLGDALPAERLDLRLEPTGTHERRIAIEPVGARGAALAARL